MGWVSGSANHPESSGPTGAQRLRTNVVVSRMPQRKHRVARVVGRRSIRLPLDSEVGPRVGLLVEAEDLHGR